MKLKNYKELSGKAMVDERLTPTDFRLLLYFMAQAGEIQAGHAEIAERLGIHHKQISQAMSHLKSYGYIERVRNKVYQLLAGQQAQESQEAPLEASELKTSAG